MSLWDTITGWVRHDASKFLYVSIDPDHVQDAQYGTEPMEAGRNYFRMWLSEMYLKRDRDWFNSWHPAVHSLIRFQFGTQEVEIPHVAGPLKLKDVNENNLDRVIQLNYPMTTLMPFNGGVVEVLAGLLAMKGEAYLNRFIKVMGDFAGLLAVPQLSAALNVAGPVANGVQELLGVSNGALHLGLHQAFTGRGGGGANELKAGYIAVILAEEGEVDKNRLWIVEDRLRYGASAASSAPFTGYAYMLFRIENREERDDWDSLTSIREPFDKAIEALLAQEEQRAESFLRTAITTALQSPDLTKADRRRVAKALKEEYNETQDLGLGAVPRELPNLEHAMQRAISVDEALALGEPTFEELFA